MVLDAEDVEQHQWAHPDHGLEEMVATEIALWAMGAGRPEAVERFRDTTLVPALLGVRDGTPAWKRQSVGGAR